MKSILTQSVRDFIGPETTTQLVLRSATSLAFGAYLMSLAWADATGGWRLLVAAMASLWLCHGIAGFVTFLRGDHTAR